jgi:phosphate-selective porin OprO and OprP
MALRFIPAALLSVALTAAVGLAEPTLEERVKALELKSESGVPDSGMKPASGVPVEVFFKDGIQFKTKGGELEAHIGGTLVFNGRGYYRWPERVSADHFLLRQARLVVEGKLFKDFEFRIQPTASSGAGFVVDDGFLGFVRWHFLKLRIGQFKAPFGLEQLQTDPYTDFPERSLMDRFVPSRELGVMVHGEPVEKVLSYALMVSNGTGRLAEDNSDKDLEARVWVRPGAASDSMWIKGIHFGLAGTWGQEHKAFGALPYTYSSLVTLTTFATAGAGAPGIRFNDHRWRGAVELAWLLGPFKVQSELMVARNAITIFGTDREHDIVRHQAGYVLASLFVTGEDQTWDRVRPKRPLFDGNGGFGAISFGARWSWLRIENDAFRRGVLNRDVSARSADEFSLGVNWYPNANVRVNLAYTWLYYFGRHTEPVVVKGQRLDDENVLIFRAQIDF